MAKSDLIKWNLRYQDLAKNQAYLSPSQCLVKHQRLIQNQERRKVLDIACGTGRNSFFLAKMGFEVDAWDISNNAISYINNNKNALAINAKQVDLDDVGFPKDHYSIILNFNFLDRNLFPKIKEALQIGGLIFFETFSLLQKNQQYISEIPKFSLAQKELLNEFAEFQVIDYQEFKIKEKGRVSMVARKVKN